MSSLPYRYQPQLQQQYQPGVAAPAPAMSSQRFCLRWNNHQSNLLSVFDQLLHDESFVDVTLAVEGHLLKAHKMVLSACSPYFQTLFINHPDKHPIVILKDVPYTDMRCLLDFMYRGEVSVDQDRLTAFLRVAESLRIKGLTEVNEEKCDTIASSLTQQNLHNNLPHLHRLQQNKRFGNNLNMLSNALLQPKRKRGRPRKLSGCSNGPDDYEKDIVQGSPEMLEVKMGMDNFTGNNSDSSVGKADMEDGVKVKEEAEPVAGTSKDQQNYPEQAKELEEFPPSEEYYDYHENNQNHTNLPSSITIELMPSVKQESVIISTEVARTLLQESEKMEAEPNAGVHFLTDDDKSTEENYEKKKSELLEYLIRQDGTVVCKLCGEVLASRTHWYRHKYKLHVNNLVNPAPLFKCHHCNVFFKSRKGYTGHVAARHQDQNQEPVPEENNHHHVVVKEEVVETSVITTSKRKFEPKSSNWEEQRVKEEKLVADIIDRVRKECEAQGAAVSRRGYSRRSTSIMNSAA